MEPITICENETVPTLFPQGEVIGSVFNFYYQVALVNVIPATSLDLSTIAAIGATPVPGDYEIIIEEVAGACVGTPMVFTLIVLPEPTVTASGDVDICVGETATISAGTNVTGGTPIFTWTEQATGTFVSNGESIAVSPIVTTIYEVTVEVDGCLSPADQVIVNVSAPGEITSTTDNTVACEGSTDLTEYELMATCAVETVNWYDAPIGGTLLGTGNTFTPANPSAMVAGSYTFYAECIDADGCTTGVRTGVLLVINPVPVAPTQDDLVICQDDAAPIVDPFSTNPAAVFNLYAGSTLLNVTPISTLSC
jgi:hypothetical protein